VHLFNKSVTTIGMPSPLSSPKKTANLSSNIKLDKYISTQWSSIKKSKVFRNISVPAKKYGLFSSSMAQIVFIFIFVLSVLYTDKLVYFSHTTGGRITVVLLLLYYCIVHPIIGAIMCMAVILYYHSDLVRSYYHECVLNCDPAASATHKKFSDLYPYYYQETTKDSFDNKRRPARPPKNGTSMEVSSMQSAYPFFPEFIGNQRPAYFNSFELKEGFEEIAARKESDELNSTQPFDVRYSKYTDTGLESASSNIPHYVRARQSLSVTLAAEKEAEKAAIFRKENCDPATGELKHKGMRVNKDMAEHVFPQLEITGTEYGTPCSPCDSTCAIHVGNGRREDRLALEGRLQSRYGISAESDKGVSDDIWRSEWFDIFKPHNPPVPKNGPRESPESS
jgi:hypothetical protein